jgi:tRNA1Val (adenine37-N6)-methyltransferase
MSRPFRFKEFTIVQASSAMKVGTDGCLLGAWAQAPKAGRLLDIGTGTGLLALMAAQRFEGLDITAVERNSMAANEARFNFEKSRWSHRITLIHQDIAVFEPTLPFDAIWSNPPFYSAQVHSPNAMRAYARQAQYLPAERLFEWAGRHLNAPGTLSLIYPSQHFNYLVGLAAEHKLFPRQACLVHPILGKAAHRVLVCFSFEKGVPDMQHLTIETSYRHDYTDEFKALLSAFYLNF